MITFNLTDDHKWLKVSDYSLESEINYLYDFFSKKSRDADFNALVDSGAWDGMDHFIDKAKKKIPIGLWKELWNFSKFYNIPVDFDVKPTLNKNFDRTVYTDFVDNLFKGILTDKGLPLYPRDYQFEGAYRALKYKYSTEELATSSGKTVIFYIFSSYLKHIGVVNKDNKVLLIVPNVSLVSQTIKAFKQYSNGLVDWNIHAIGGKKNDFDIDKFNECDMMITTYQSMLNLVPKCIDSRLENLIMKPIKKGKDDKRAVDIMTLKKRLNVSKILDISSQFKVVNVDEAHKSRGSSISNILESCINWEYKLGLSGTLKLGEEYSDFFKMQQNMGPLVMTLDARFLIDNGYSPDIKIKQIFLEYDIPDPTVYEYLKIQKDKDLRRKFKNQFRTPADFGKKMLEIEKSIIYDTTERIEFLNAFIQRLGKNTLILFSDVKHEYGLNMSNKIKEWNPNTFYIDGEVASEDRDRFKDIMEENDDVIIVASYGTFATGIDLKNVYHIIFLESTKAEITIRQAIGRGMRYLIGKNLVIIWDVIDSLFGYSIKHSKERVEIYNKQKFEILKPVLIKLSKFSKRIISH